MREVTIADLVDGDDGLPAEVVGSWAKEKHDLLCRYIDISRAPRKKFLRTNGAGAAYIDLFCGCGRARVRETGEFIDGGCVAAWRMSRDRGSPFSKVLIGDTDKEKLEAATERLRRLGAPVEPLLGGAKENAFVALQRAPYSGLNVAFLDPYNLRTLDFEIIRTLSRLKRIDMLIHVSTMDLQRFLDKHLREGAPALDAFAPGWREVLSTHQSQRSIREDIVEYWMGLLAGLGVWSSDEVKLITGPRNQRLYWLVLAAKHNLAHQFWEAVNKTDGQFKLL